MVYGIKTVKLWKQKRRKEVFDMCTAATYKTKDFYMGRTLDYEFSYGEQITITPRNYEFDFRFAGKIKSALCDHRYGICSGRLSTVL